MRHHHHRSLTAKTGRVLAAALVIVLLAFALPFPADAASSAPSAWAADEVNSALALGIVPGTFSHNYQAATTREEFCEIAVDAVAYIYGCAPESVIAMKGLTTLAPFSDSADDYVTEAHTLGIVSGVGGNKFDPFTRITREQAAVMIDNIAVTVCGYTPSGAAPAYTDAGKISGYAAAAVRDCAMMGVMTGSGGLFNPQSPYTHEQSVLTMYRLCGLLKPARERAVFSADELSRIGDIRARMAGLGVTAASAYQQTPSLAGTYVIGTLRQDFLNDGLGYINFARYMAGLPQVSLSDPLNTTAQSGAFVLAATKVLSHSPVNSVGLPDSIFGAGSAACGASNLGQGFDSLYDFDRVCMYDSDARNIGDMGHRRWLLSPRMGATGEGFVNRWCVTYVLDTSANFTQWDTINWPPAGLFPKSEFPGDEAWSVSLGGNYTVADPGAIQVKITRQSDGKSWTLSQSSAKSGQEYFSFNSALYGFSGPCVIFRPDVSEYIPGDAYTVAITGLANAAGAPAAVGYTVKFF